MTDVDGARAGSERPPDPAGSERPTDPASSDARDRLTRADAHRQAVDQLIHAASGLAATIAVTEELAQQRADLIAKPPRKNTSLGLTPRRQSIVSLAEAARKTGRHPEVLRRWCSEGRLPAIRIGRTWGITTETLATLMNHAARSRPRLPTPSERA